MLCAFTFSSSDFKSPLPDKNKITNKQQASFNRHTVIISLSRKALKCLYEGEDALTGRVRDLDKEILDLTLRKLFNIKT